MANMIHVLGISGSLRKASFNTGLLRAAKEVLPEGMLLESFDLSSIPLYNADIDSAGAPEPVQVFKEKLAGAAGLLIATPEYNYSVPGVLKNAIDWASRTPKNSPLNGKPVGMMGAGGVGGTMRGQMHLRQILLFNGCHVLSKPEVYVMKAREKFDSDGNLTDGDTRALIREFLHSFKGWILRLGTG